MRFYLLSDNIDTQIGMRLAGIDGVVVHEKLIKLIPEYVYDIKLNRKSPLIVEIPDRHGTSQISETINRYVKEAVGITL